MYRLIYVFLICFAGSAHAQSFITEEWEEGDCYEKKKTGVLQLASRKMYLTLPTDDRLISKLKMDSYCKYAEVILKLNDTNKRVPINKMGSTEILCVGADTVNYSGKVLNVYGLIINKPNYSWTEHIAWFVLYCPQVGYYYVVDNYGIYDRVYWFYTLNSKTNIDKDMIAVLLKHKYKAGLMLKCE